MPARTLNDFFAGFFYGQTKEDFEVDMAITVQSNGESNRGQSHWKRGDTIKTINIEEKEDKEQEVTVRNESVPQRKEKSTLSWFEEFAIEWSEIFIPNKQKRNPLGGDLL